jgi:hypothetical protein
MLPVDIIECFKALFCYLIDSTPAILGWRCTLEPLGLAAMQWFM